MRNDKYDTACTCTSSGHCRCIQAPLKMLQLSARYSMHKYRWPCAAAHVEFHSEVMLDFSGWTDQRRPQQWTNYSGPIALPALPARPSFFFFPSWLLGVVDWVLVLLFFSPMAECFVTQVYCIPSWTFPQPAILTHIQERRIHRSFTQLEPSPFHFGNMPL